MFHFALLDLIWRHIYAPIRNWVSQTFNERSKRSTLRSFCALFQMLHFALQKIKVQNWYQSTPHLRSNSQLSFPDLYWALLTLQFHFQISLFLLVIIGTCQALPTPQDAKKDVLDEIVHDEAKETAYEDLRDHDLQESLNAGQSGLALELIAQGENPTNLWRPKR